MQVDPLSLVIILLGLIIGWYVTTGSKSQTIRLWDIFLYGPFLILVAFLLPSPSTSKKWAWIRVGLLLIGTTTITYNLRNYLKEK